MAKKVALAKVTTKKDIIQDKKINKLMKLVKKVETKYFDLQSSVVQDIVRTPNVYNLSNIAQGNDISNRVGDKVYPKWLLMDYQVYVGNPIPQLANIRIVILQDRFQNGTDPTFSGSDNSVFETPVAGIGETLVPRLKTNLKQFKILYDKVHELATINSAATTSYATGKPYVHHKIRLPLKGSINYDSTAGADASNKEDNLYMMVLSNNNTATNINFNFYSRLAYTDQ